jgi:glucose-6-phosphate 1-dehydrogenase
MMVMSPGDEMAAQTVEMVASRSPHSGDMDAYERVLGAAMEGDATLFAREDYVEEAWRIVDPVLTKGTPIREYETNTWGPAEADRMAPVGDWCNPTIGDEVLTITHQAA